MDPSQTLTGIPVDLLFICIASLAAALGGFAWHSVSRRLDDIVHNAHRRGRQIDRIAVRLGLDIYEEPK
jgi:hypothetical protein